MATLSRLSKPNWLLDSRPLDVIPQYEWRVVRNDSQIPQDSEPFQLLDNDIHLMWRCENWRTCMYQPSPYISPRALDAAANNVTSDFYNRLTPALRLATILVERAAPHLVRIARAPTVIAADGKTMFDPNWIPRQVDFQFLQYAMLHLARNTRIVLRPLSSGYSQSAPMTMMHTTAFINIDATHNVPFDPIIIQWALASEIYNEVNRDDWDQKQDDAKVAVLFMLADYLVHEVGHALWTRRTYYGTTTTLTTMPYAAVNRFTELHRTNPEPSMWPERFHELGFSVICFILGGETVLPWVTYVYREHGKDTITKADYAWDGSLGITMSKKNWFDMNHSDLTYRVSPATIRSFFNKKSWPTSTAVLYLIGPQYLTDDQQ